MKIILVLAILTAFLITVIALPQPSSGGVLLPPPNAYDENGYPIPTSHTLDEIVHFYTDRFRDNQDGTVTDTFTGLMWDQNANRFGENWFQGSGTYDPTNNPDSTDLCGDLVLGGYTDWRLPAIQELQSLVDCTYGNDPCITNTFNDGKWQEGNSFLQVQTDSSPPQTYYPVYWSATTMRVWPCEDTCAYILNFTDGNVTHLLKYGKATIWCVRGP